MPDDSRRSTDHETSDAAPILVRGAGYLLWLILAIAAFYPGLRLWGLDHLAYFPPWVRVAVLLIAGLSFLPPVSRLIYDSAQAFGARWKRLRRWRSLLLILIAALLTCGFWLFRSSTQLLGDSQMIARSFEVIFANRHAVKLQSVMDILRLEKLYPGAMTAYYGAAKAAVDGFGAGPVTGIRLLNCIFGGLVGSILLLVARKKSVPSEVVAWLFVSVLFSGAIELFAGYVEFYPPFMFVAFLYVLAGYRLLHSGRGALLLLVLFALCVFMHVQGILLGPSLLYLLWGRYFGSTRRRLLRQPFWFVLGLTIAVVAIGAWVTAIGRHFLPLVASPEVTGALSPIHLLDVFNELLLVLPAAPIAAAMLWVSIARSRTEAASAATERRVRSAPAVFTPDFAFALHLFIPALIYLVLFRTEIGVARDWDLFSMVAVGLLPLAYLSVTAFIRALRHPASVAPVLVPMMVLTVAQGGAWIGVNSSWTKSAARFERLLEFDTTHSDYASESLALLYHDKGDLDRATRIMEKTAKAGTNDRYTVRLARFYAEAGRYEEAQELLRPVMNREPKFVEARVSYLQILETQSAYEEMYTVAKTGTAYLPKMIPFWYYLGESAAALGSVTEAREAYRTLLSLNPTPDVRRQVEMLQSRLAPEAPPPAQQP